MYKNIFIRIVFFVVAFLFFTGCIFKKRIPTGQTEQAFIQTKNGNKTGYLLFLPEDYYDSKEKKYPAIIFIHGTGDQGTWLGLVRRLVLPKMLDNKRNFPFIVISPQYLLNKDYDCQSGISIDNFKNFYEHLIKHYKIDTDRVYLTGFSFGGYMTWNIAIKNPELFAAIAPVCGYGVLENLYKFYHLPADLFKIKKLPVWVFHGDLDAEVPIRQEEMIVERLKQIGGNVKFTIYSDLGHECWEKTYSNPNLYNWFLENIRDKF